ncbi:hypothetical protein TgHK011_009357 [Trichoderma gracile]|nr:hypothetical protein TgHK011_009357 [Trichoderma gracile]
MVPLEALHRLDLGAHAPQGLLIGHGDSLQHGQVGAVDGLGQLDEVDVCEAALGQVLLDLHAVVADLDLGARGKGAGRGARSRRLRGGIARVRVAVVRLLGHSVAVRSHGWLSSRRERERERERVCRTATASLAGSKGQGEGASTAVTYQQGAEGRAGEWMVIPPDAFRMEALAGEESGARRGGCSAAGAWEAGEAPAVMIASQSCLRSAEDAGPWRVKADRGVAACLESIASLAETSTAVEHRLELA